MSQELQDIRKELLVVPVLGDDDQLSEVPKLDAAVGGAVARARSSGEFRAHGPSVFVTPVTADGWSVERVALAGINPAKGEIATQLRTAMARASAAAVSRCITSISVLQRGDLDTEPAVQAVIEGLMLGAFSDQRYKTSSEDEPVPADLRDVGVVVRAEQDQEAWRGALKGWQFASACNLARELANDPSNLLTPSVFADRANELAGTAGCTVEVLDEAAIRELGMGLLLGVARGSREPPRLVVMRHEPPDAPAEPVLGFVGKGVTFDSGGISIKPSDGMDLMKRDMAGGAAVVGAMRAIASLKLGVRVIGIVPMTENMPGGRAIKPGDILTGASGKTAEVLNTDAEGRLILADALWYAKQLGATHLVDVATLTGACVVALGHAASGLFGEPDDWLAEVRAAGERAGERLWPLPLYEDYREQLRSEMADLANVGGRAGGACTAAMFLRAFVESPPWAHVDIAGTAWPAKERGPFGKGATGVLVRTLAELAWGVARGAPAEGAETGN